MDEPKETYQLYRENRLFYPVSISLLAHVVAVFLSMIFIVPGYLVEPEEDILKFNVRAVTKSPIVQTRGNTSDPRAGMSSVALRHKSARGMRKTLKDIPVETITRKDVSQAQSALEPLTKRPELQGIEASSRPELESILARTQERRLKESVGPRQQSVSEAGEIARMTQAHGPGGAGDLVRILGQPLQGMRLGASGSVDMDPEEGMPGFTPVTGVFGSGDVDQGPFESRGDLLKYESLDDFLDIGVSTYEDPAGSGRYYMVKIFARKDIESFHVMPKEILFAIDCSLSISRDRLEEVKRGVRYCLEHLNKNDVFNLVAFKEEAKFFSPNPLPGTPENIKAAERFVMELTPDRRTNVYAAFKTIMKNPLNRIPCNVMLVSDGRPTYGIVDSRELINSVTRLNKNTRPVFVFSGGAKVNRYLLDFVAYQNRGWSEFIRRTGDIHQGLADFYDKIKDPILLDLKYQLNGLGAGDVFPKSLPDFYRNAEFTLYGKYTNEDTFSMRLVGEVDDKTKELVFTRSLRQAPKGGPEIMRGWAFNKIYYLISQVTARGQDPKALEAIRDLGTRYKITTPYSPELETKD